MQRSATQPQNAVTIVTPHAADAQIAAGFLGEHGIASNHCASLTELAGLPSDSIACVLVVEEALAEPQLSELQQAIQLQPTWSDLPIILIAREATPLGKLVDTVFPMAGNITVLQRPLHPVSLVSAVNVAMRARARQYQVRDLLALRDQALRQRDEFLAMLAHELRNPLAPIRNAAHILGGMRVEDPNFERCRTMIDKQARHITRLVDDLLDVSRIELGKVELRMQAVELNECVSAAAEACRPITNSHRHAVNLNLAREAIWVQADPVRLEQCVSNLIVNAAKFTPDGGTITVEVLRDGPIGVVAVSDNGVGIKPDKLESIFELFAQDEVGLARTQGGLGIGLTLVKRLIQLHGGSVRASSEGPGKGSRFEARLPLAPAQAASLPSRGAAGEGAAHRVLIVEDADDARESLALLLASWKHEVIHACDGPQGVRLALETHPDVGIIDVGLPGFDGYEVARRIRRGSHGHAIRLIALTGYGQASDRAKAIEAGFDLHLLKPVDPTVLREVLADPPQSEATARTM